MKRPDGRNPDELRDFKITKNFVKSSDGSVLIECGRTRVICNASVEGRVPGFLKGSGTGWVTAEYGMLPGATGSRNRREATHECTTATVAEWHSATKRPDTHPFPTIVSHCVSSAVECHHHDSITLPTCLVPLVHKAPSFTQNPQVLCVVLSACPQHSVRGSRPSSLHHGDQGQPCEHCCALPEG